MFRLTRQVRFAVHSEPGLLSAAAPTNSYAGFPSLRGIGHFFELDVTLSGPLDAGSQYLRNIKEIDDVVRRVAVPAVERAIRGGEFAGGGGLLVRLFDLLRDGWPGASLEALRFALSPFLSLGLIATEYPMVRLSQKFEFSAAHRLHNPSLDDEANRRTFGKCNNPLGHGHNYEVQVTLVGEPDANGVVADVPTFERTVAERVIDRFDHKHLNLEVPEFKALIPSVENIAMTAYRLLKPAFGTKLASVTVWETPKTWCEYSE